MPVKGKKASRAGDEDESEGGDGLAMAMVVQGAATAADEDLDDPTDVLTTQTALPSEDELVSP